MSYNGSGAVSSGAQDARDNDVTMDSDFEDTSGVKKANEPGVSSGEQRGNEGESPSKRVLRAKRSSSNMSTGGTASDSMP